MSANIKLDSKLDIFSLTTLLISAQYGLRFLSCTAEQAIQQGIESSLLLVRAKLVFLVAMQRVAAHAAKAFV